MDNKSKTSKLNVEQSTSMNKVKSSTSMNKVKSSTSMNKVKSSTSMNKVKSSTSMNKVKSSTMNDMFRKSTLNVQKTSTSNRLNMKSTTNANVRSQRASTISQFNGSTTDVLEGDYNIYLGKTVGKALVLCLNDLVHSCPDDPITFIAQWLYKFIDCELYYNEKRKYLHALRAMYNDMESLRKQSILKKIRMRDEYAELRRKEIECHFKSPPLSGFKTRFPQMSRTTDTTKSTSTKWPTQNKSLQSQNARSSPHFDENGHLVLEFNEDGTRNSDYDLYDGLDDDEVMILDGGVPRKSTRMEAERSGSTWQDREHLASLRGMSHTAYTVEDTDGNRTSRGKSSHARMSKRMSVYREMSQADVYGLANGCASWGVSARFGLVCQHPVLGDMEPRANLIYPETPAWWEQQGYREETLYDHEVYSRSNTDKYPNYDAIEHLNYKDFIEPGQWLDPALLKNANTSYKNLVQKIPDEKKKRIRKPQEGDYFPPESDGYRDAELRRERLDEREEKRREEDLNKKAKLAIKSEGKKMPGGKKSPAPSRGTNVIS